MKKRWKITLYITGALVLLIVLAKAFGGRKDEKKVTVEAAALRNVVETVSASGKIQPMTEIKIQSEVSGQIIELPVKEGDVVQKGQLLVKINPDLYTAALNRASAALNSARSNLASAKARLAQSEAQLHNAELVYNRSKKLFADGAIAQAEMDNSTATYETAKAEVVAARESIRAGEYSIESAQAGFSEASDNLRRTTIIAPMSGTVTALTKELGENVLGTSMMSGDVIMKVSALNNMEVNVEVNESDIVRVHLGDTANVEVDAYENEKFKGVVYEIGNTALNAISGTLSVDQVTNFSVKIRIVRESYQHLCEGKDESYSPFRPGMSASVDIQTTSLTNVVTIPIKALTSRNDTSSTGYSKRMAAKKEEAEMPATAADAGKTSDKDEPIICVFVLDEATKKVKLQPVKSGIQDRKYVHIKEGLKEGDKVVTGPFDLVSRKLKNRDEVTVDEGFKKASKP